MRSLPICAVVLCLASLPSVALADGPDKSNSSFRLRQGDTAGGAAEMGRSSARAGDCAAALDYFDRAISVHPDPAVVRDRGLCHDKLNHPFPAIRDFRTYLAERPDAPDGDQIRSRLGALESSVGISKEDNKGDSEKVADTPAQRNALEALLEDERLSDAAATSPLRRSSGGVLGAYGGTRTFFGKNQTSFFDNTDGGNLGYQVGIAARYSMGAYFDVLGEGGLVSTGTAGDQSGASGPGFLLAGQLRLPVGKNASDAILIALGPGYERYSNKLTGTASMIMGLARVGYRHVFGQNFGLELAGYGGIAHATYLDTPLHGSINDRDFGLIGLQIDLLLGF